MSRRRSSFVIRILVFALFSFFSVFAILRSPLASSGPLKSLSALTGGGASVSPAGKGGTPISLHLTTGGRVSAQQSAEWRNPEIPFDTGGSPRDPGPFDPDSVTIANPQPQQGQSRLTTPLSTFVVTRSDDIPERGTCAVGDCTLREAIIAANTNPGPDIITFAASLNGTPITITQTGVDPAEDAADYGDLDITDSITITGNGSGNTIIQAGASAFSGIDKIFAINPNCSSGGSPIQATLTDMTIRNGHNAGPFNAVQFNHTGGAIDFCNGGPVASGSNSLTMTNVILTGNQVDQGAGGGLNIAGTGTAPTTVTLTNVQFLNNRTLDPNHVSAGAGAAIEMNTTSTNFTINITNCLFDSNQAQNSSGGGLEVVSNINAVNVGILNIHNSVFSNNQAKGAGGGIDLSSTSGADGKLAATIDQQTVVKNNVSGAFSGTSLGGGIHIEGVHTQSNFTLSKITVIGNSNSGGAVTQFGGGGIAVGTIAGSFNMSFSRIANNLVSGGGVGSGFRKDNQAGTATATNNWWGCSDGPSVAPCDTAVLVAGGSGTQVLTSSPFLRVHTTATQNPIPLGGTTGLLARVQNSTGVDTAVSNLDVFVNSNINAGSPLPVAWGAATNTVTPINTTLVSSGGFAQATATYNGTNKVHLDQTRAKVDNDFITGAHTNVVGITVLAPPSIAKAFTADNIPINGTTPLTFTITNPNTGDGLNGLAFTDNFPAGLVVGPTPGVVNNCGGTFTAVAGASSVNLSAGTISFNGAGTLTCTITVTVQGTTDGVKNNTTSTITATDAGGLTGNTASDNILVANPPHIVKGFNAATIPLNVNAATAVTFNVSNTNSNTTLNGIVFTDTFPAGLVVATPNGLTGTCPGVVATPGAGSVQLPSTTLAPGASCTISVNITGTTAGVKNNSVTASSTTTGVLTDTSAASITVVAPPTISKAFGVASIPLNGSTSLTFTITNPNLTVALNGVAFSDSLPSGLVVHTPNGFSNTCGGTVTATAGSGSVSLSGGTVALNSSCTIFINNVDGTTNGTKSNITGAITSTEGGTGTTSNTANLDVFAPPQIVKAFGASTIAVGGTTSLTFTITNPAGNPGVLTGLGFTDTLPAGLVVATPNALSNTCAGTPTATTGSGSVSLSGGTSAAAGNTCVLSVNVTGSTSGIKNNSVTVSSTNGGTGNTSLASLTVASPPTISVAFGAASIPLNGTTTLTVTINNPNAISLTGLSFTDTLPGGLVVASPSNLVNTCAGTPSATPTGSTDSLSAGTVGASTSCSITVDVTGTTAGVKSNNTGVVSSTESGPGAGSNIASLLVVAPPTVSKVFGAASIPLNGSTSLQFTVANPNTASALSGVAFTDTLPAGLVVATPNGLIATCGAGTITAVAGSGSVSLSGGTLTPSAGAGSTCIYTVNVTGTTPGTKSNVTGAITSTEGGTGTTSNTANLNVVAPPTFSKAFGVSQIPLNGTTTLTFTITNPAGNAVSLTGVAFTDTLPAGLVVGTPNGLVTNGNCGAPSVTATAGTGSVTASSITVGVGATCTITANVTGTTSGIKNNVTGAITSTNGGTGGTANASLTVASAPVISKSFTPSTIGVGSTSTSTLSFTIQNPNNATTLTGIGFTDTFPAGLQIFTPSGLSGSCGGGTITATAGSTSVSLSGASLASSTSCTFSVLVTATTTGVKNNTTSAVTSTEAGNGNTASATLTVLANPQIAKNFASAFVDVGSSVALSFTVTNPNAGNSLTGVHFSDPLPSGLRVASPNGLTGSCGGGTIIAIPNATTIILSGATIPASSSCTFSVNVTATSGGNKANLTGDVGSTNGGTGNAASAFIDACEYIVSPTALSFPQGGGTGTVTVTPNLGTCTWFAAANDAFIHVTSGAGPNTNVGTVQFTVDPAGGARSGSLTIATQLVIVDQTNPTDIKLSSFNAYDAGNSTMLTWDTGLEINNLGFNVYRQVGSDRVKVNPSLIAGSALMVGTNVNVQAGFGYAWKDETYDGNATYWLEEIDLNGSSIWHGPIGIQASGLNKVSRSKSVLLSDLNSRAASVENGIIQRGYPAEFSPDPNFIGPVSPMTSGKLATTNRPSLKLNQPSASLKNQWTVAAKSGVKFGVNKTGWYHVNVADMIAAGFDSNVDPRSLQMFVNGSEVPIKVNSGNPSVLSPNDSVEFFGVALDSPTSNTQMYWLVSGSGTGRRISSQQSIASTNNGGSTSFDYTVERKERMLYISSLTNGDAENFFGQVISSTPVKQTLSVQHLDQNAVGQAEIEIALQGFTLVSHNVGLALNGTPIQTISFNAMDHSVVRVSVPQSALVEGDNTITLTQGASGDISLVDYVRITYAHTYVAENNSLFATANGPLPIKIGGFSTNQIRAIDVTNSSHPMELVGTIDGANNNFAITVDGAKKRDLIAFTPTQMLQPVSITANHPSNLNRGGNASFVIITNKDFAGSIEPLRALRQSQGYQVTVVDVEDIYDEFNYGVHSPYAIKDFLNWTYLHWSQQPQYVMLAGSASIDPRNYLGLGNLDFVPTKLIDATQMETASDDWFVDFNNDGVPNMAIGRLPVRTAAEATQMVNKIITYDQSTSTNKTVVLVSDLNDGIDFTASNNVIQSLIPAQMDVVNIVRDQSTLGARAALMNQLTQGNRIINYAGHGSINLWRGGMLTDDDMLSLANTRTSPLVVSMTCLNGYFQEPRLASLGESLVKVNGGGAISAWASSGMTNVTNQTMMNQAFFKQLMGSTSVTIGQAIKAAKSTDVDKDVRRTWILFGDPTMKIK